METNHFLASNNTQGSNNRFAINAIRSRAYGTESLKTATVANVDDVKNIPNKSFSCVIYCFCRSSEMKSKSFARSTDICLPSWYGPTKNTNFGSLLRIHFMQLCYATLHRRVRARSLSCSAMPKMKTSILRCLVQYRNLRLVGII